MKRPTDRIVNMLKFAPDADMAASSGALRGRPTELTQKSMGAKLREIDMNVARAATGKIEMPGSNPPAAQDMPKLVDALDPNVRLEGQREVSEGVYEEVTKDGMIVRSGEKKSVTVVDPSKGALPARDGSEALASEHVETQPPTLVADENVPDPLADDNAPAQAGAADDLLGDDDNALVARLYREAGNDPVKLKRAGEYAKRLLGQAQAAQAAEPVAAPPQRAAQPQAGDWNEEEFRQKKFREATRNMLIGAGSDRELALTHAYHSVYSPDKGVQPLLYEIPPDADEATRSSLAAMNNSIRAAILSAEAKAEQAVAAERYTRAERANKAAMETYQYKQIETSTKQKVDAELSRYANDHFPKLGTPIGQQIARQRIDAIMSDTKKYPDHKFPTPESIVKEALRQLRAEDAGENSIGIFHQKKFVDVSPSPSMNKVSASKAPAGLGAQQRAAVAAPVAASSVAPRSLKDMAAHDARIREITNQRRPML